MFTETLGPAFMDSYNCPWASLVAQTVKNQIMAISASVVHGCLGVVFLSISIKLKFVKFQPSVSWRFIPGYAMHVIPKVDGYFWEWRIGWFRFLNTLVFCSRKQTLKYVRKTLRLHSHDYICLVSATFFSSLVSCHQSLCGTCFMWFSFPQPTFSSLNS